MGSTGRNKNPMGDPEKYAKVRLNNRLVSRLCNILWLAFKRGVYWTIEQPASSVMFQHKRLKKLIAKQGAVPINFDMGAFGASSEKGTLCVGTVPFKQKLERRQAWFPF